jgi:hypothetical protein
MDEVDEVIGALIAGVVIAEVVAIRDCASKLEIKLLIKSSTE